MLSILADVLLFLGGSVGIGAAVRAWRAGPVGEPTPTWWAIGLYTTASLLFFSPALLTRDHHIATDIAYLWQPWNSAIEEPVWPKNLLVADPPLQMLPFREIVRRRLLAGELPLWVHELGTGQPLLANAQSAPFAPLHLAALPLPTLRALTVAAAWQAVLGLLLVHALLRRLRAPPAGAAVAAVAFAFSSFSVVWAYYPLGMAIQWLPGIFLGLVLLAEDAPRATAGLVVCALGLVLAGHPSSMAHAALASAVVVAALWMRGPPVGRGRLLLRAGVAGALTFVLAAPFLLPVLEHLPASERKLALLLDPAATDPPDFEARFAAFVVDPLVAGSPREGIWKAPWIFNEQTSLYAGLVTLVLATAGAIVRRGRVLGIFLGGLAALLAGFKIEPFHTAVDSLPGFEDLAHGRWRIYWILAVAVAAGLSVEALQRSRLGRTVFAALTVVAVGLLVGLGTPLAPWLRAWWWSTAIGALAVLAVPWGLSRPTLEKPRRRLVSGIALAAIALDLGLLGIRYNPAVAPKMDLAPPPVQQWLIERHQEALTGPASPRPFRVLGEDWALFPNLPAVDGLWNALSFDPAHPMRPARFSRVRFTGGLFTGQPVIQSSDRLDLGLVSFMGVRYLLTARERSALPAPWRLANRGRGGDVWENSEALPLFFVPRVVERAPEPAEGTPLQRSVVLGEAMQRVLEIEDFADLAVVEGTAGFELPLRAEQQGSVQLVDLSSNRFDLEVVSSSGAVVVSSVSHDRGWRVQLDGEPLPLLRANAAFLAFRIPSGAHRVRLLYSPAGWRWGWVLFALGLATVLTGLLVRRLR